MTNNTVYMLASRHGPGGVDYNEQGHLYHWALWVCAQGPATFEGP